MASSLGARVLVDWLESEVVRVLGDGDRLELAYSGGLGSTLLAAIARKRCDLTCYTVGLRGSADLRAAEAAALFLDYRVEQIRITPSNAVALARGLAATVPMATAPEILSLLPAWTVAARTDRRPLLAGFGTAPTSSRVRDLLPNLRISSPLLRLEEGETSAVRRRLSACADVLGIPAAFGKPRRRPPGSGSGIGPAIRQIAASRHTTIRAILRPKTAGRSEILTHVAQTGKYK